MVQLMQLLYLFVPSPRSYPTIMNYLLFNLFFFTFFLNDDLSFYKEDQNGDQNTNSPCDQLDDNVDT
jgi:hypothetical protein